MPDLIDFRRISISMKIVKRVRKNLIASVLAVLFAVGLLCAGLSAPAAAFASRMPDCSSRGSATGPCQPRLCNLVASHNLLSQGAVVSSRSFDSARDGLLLLPAVLSVSSHGEISLVAKQLSTVWTDYRPDKIPVHLFNSVLTL